MCTCMHAYCTYVRIYIRMYIDGTLSFCITLPCMYVLTYMLAWYPHMVRNLQGWLILPMHVRMQDIVIYSAEVKGRVYGVYCVSEFT